MALTFGALVLLAHPTLANPFSFSTGDPDGLMATASRPGPGAGSGVNQDTESADDFVLSNRTEITTASFTGLVPAGVDLSNDISQVRIEIYHVFPKDVVTNRTITVPTRANSPSDFEFDERDSASTSLTFTVTLLNPSFTVSNSVDTGIHPAPDQRTLGEGPVTGQEVRFDVKFATPLDLPADHYFFVPQVLLTNADDHFLWLSAPKPIVPPGTPFAIDFQEWIRNADLDPDWLRVANDIIGNPPAFNATFSLAGEIPPHDLAILRIKPPRNIKLNVGDPSLAKRVKVQIQNLSPHSETISDLSVLADLVSVKLSDLQDTGCAPPTADLIQGPPNNVPKTLEPNRKLNVFFTVTFDPEGCVPDAKKGKGHQDFSYTAHIDHAALDGNPDTNPSNDTLDATVVTDVFLKR
jgi:hypothetical protein